MVIMNNGKDVELQEVPKRNGNIVSRQIAEEYILVPIRKTAGSIDSIIRLMMLLPFYGKEF